MIVSYIHLQTVSYRLFLLLFALVGSCVGRLALQPKDLTSLCRCLAVRPSIPFQKLGISAGCADRSCGIGCCHKWLWRQVSLFVCLFDLSLLSCFVFVCWLLFLFIISWWLLVTGGCLFCFLYVWLVGWLLLVVVAAGSYCCWWLLLPSLLPFIHLLSRSALDSGSELTCRDATTRLRKKGCLPMPLHQWAEYWLVVTIRLEP